MRITDYRIVEAIDSFHFIEVIKRMIAEGWQPFGGISIAAIDHNNPNQAITYAQAMVLREPSVNT